MDHLDFQQLTETERVATYGAIFAMAKADGAVEDEEVIHIFECMDLDGLSDPGVRTVRSYLMDPPDLLEALEPLLESDNDVRYGVLVHLMDVALADTVYAPGERVAIAKAGKLLGATTEQLDAIEAFIREVRGIEADNATSSDAKARLEKAQRRLDEAGVPRKAIVMSGSLAALGAGGVGAAAIAGLGLALAPGLGLAAASGAAMYFATRLILGKAPKRDEAADAQTRRVIAHLQHAIEETRGRATALERVRGGTPADAQDRAAHVRHLNDQVMGLQRLLARKRAELQ